MGQHDWILGGTARDRSVLTIIEQVKSHGLFDKMGCPNDFEEEIEISFKQMDYSKPVDAGLSNIFL